MDEPLIVAFERVLSMTDYRQFDKAKIVFYEVLRNSSLQEATHTRKKLMRLLSRFSLRAGDIGEFEEHLYSLCVNSPTTSLPKFTQTSHALTRRCPSNHHRFRPAILKSIRLFYRVFSRKPTLPTNTWLYHEEKKCFCEHLDECGLQKLRCLILIFDKLKSGEFNPKREHSTPLLRHHLGYSVLKMQPSPNSCRKQPAPKKRDQNANIPDLLAKRLVFTIMKRLFKVFDDLKSVTSVVEPVQKLQFLLSLSGSAHRQNLTHWFHVYKSQARLKGVMEANAKSKINNALNLLQKQVCFKRFFRNLRFVEVERANEREETRSMIREDIRSDQLNFDQRFTTENQLAKIFNTLDWIENMQEIRRRQVFTHHIHVEQNSLEYLSQTRNVVCELLESKISLVNKFKNPVKSVYSEYESIEAQVIAQLNEYSDQLNKLKYDPQSKLSNLIAENDLLEIELQQVQQKVRSYQANFQSH